MPHWDPFWPLDEIDTNEKQAIIESRSVPAEEQVEKTTKGISPTTPKQKRMSLEDIQYDKLDWPGWQNRPWDLSVLKEQQQQQGLPQKLSNVSENTGTENKAPRSPPATKKSDQKCQLCRSPTTDSTPRKQPTTPNSDREPALPTHFLHSRPHSPTDSCCNEDFQPDIQMPCQHIMAEKIACHGCGQQCGSCSECVMEWYDEHVHHHRRRRHSLLRKCDYSLTDLREEEGATQEGNKDGSPRREATI